MDGSKEKLNEEQIEEKYWSKRRSGLDSEVSQILGRRITGVILAGRKSSPYGRLFLLFDNEQHYEFYVTGEDIRTTSGMWPASMEETRNYVRRSGEILFEAYFDPRPPTDGPGPVRQTCTAPEAVEIVARRLFRDLRRRLRVANAERRFAENHGHIAKDTWVIHVDAEGNRALKEHVVCVDKESREIVYDGGES